MFNDVLNEKMQSQGDLPWTWSMCLGLELLPSDILESARETKEKIPSSFTSREEQGFWFSVRVFWIFYEGFTILFSLFWQFSLSKSQPLESMIDKLIYRWICCGFGGKNKWDLNFLAHCSIAFWSQPFVFDTNIGFGKMQAWTGLTAG